MALCDQSWTENWKCHIEPKQKNHTQRCMRNGSSLVKVPFYISTILLFLNQEKRSMLGGCWRNFIREKNIWEMGWKAERREFLLWITSCSRTNKSMFYSNIPILQLDACPEVLQIWYAFLIPWSWPVSFISHTVLFTKLIKVCFYMKVALDFSHLPLLLSIFARLTLRIRLKASCSGLACVNPCFELGVLNCILKFNQYVWSDREPLFMHCNL